MGTPLTAPAQLALTPMGTTIPRRNSKWGPPNRASPAGINAHNINQNGVTFQNTVSGRNTQMVLLFKTLFLKVVKKLCYFSKHGFWK